MALEAIKAAIDELMDEVVARPEDAHMLREQIREKLSEYEALGLAVPDDLKKLVDDLSEADTGDDSEGEGGGGDGGFDNLPV